MRRIIAFGLFMVILAGTAAATDKADVRRTVQQFVDGFNKGDMKSALALCASPAAIIDEFPPFAWQGANACADWARDYDATAQKEGMTAGRIGMAAPLSVDVAGDRAYAVFPTRFTYRQKGKVVSELPARLTVALQKTVAGWRITAWAWSKR